MYIMSPHYCDATMIPDAWNASPLVTGAGHAFQAITNHTWTAFFLYWTFLIPRNLSLASDLHLLFQLDTRGFWEATSSIIIQKNGIWTSRSFP